MKTMRWLMSGACLAVVTAGLISCRTAGVAPDARLILAQSGRTEYVIVRPEAPTAIDEYAARVLALYLKQITGADFQPVGPAEAPPGKPRIFVGLSKPALQIAGPNPLAELADQEHVARSAGQDILLYGRGVHGNLYAVMEFLENSLGWRWYSVFENPVLPAQASLALEPFNRKKGFSYACRKVDLQRSFDFFYQQKMNMGFDERVRKLARRHGADTNRACFVSEIREETGGHSLFSYIPPNPKAPGADRFSWMENTNYFATNPEYFSQWESGKRVPDKQLCFASPGLRAELTKNVLKQIVNSGAGGEGMLLDICAMDSPGPFCYCGECRALEEKYKSPGGPLYDYLLELCAMLKEKHPQVLVKTYAYRRSQTQKPPVLPAGGKLPANLVIDFAPIEDNYFADWTHPDEKIQETCRDLQAWNEIAQPGKLWAWLYPNPWGSGYGMPVGNLERNINNIRLMHKAGVRGLKTDHCGFHARAGLSELQSYLFYKLMQDVNCDTGAIIKEFTDNFYGPAAPLMRKYLGELEGARKAMQILPPGVSYRSNNLDDKTFPYLTPENIHRWQTYFDGMEKSLAGQPERMLLNVRIARRELDLATLWKWFELKKDHPDYYSDHMVCVNRINAVNEAKAPPAPEWETKNINRQANKGPGPDDFMVLIEAGGKSKPLPSEFAGIVQEKIRQCVPQYSNRIPGRKVILDPEAAFGYAVPVHMPDLPFNFGFYQGDAKAHGARRALALNEITPGEYKVYKLGEITITPDCKIWFSARSWATKLELGERLYEPGAENKWEAYVSVKFDGGGIYGGKANETLLPLADRINYGDIRHGKKETELVLVDRIILVKKSANQF